MTAACGGDDASDAVDDTDSVSPGASSQEETEPSSGVDDGTTTTAPLSPKEEVVRDYEAASAAFSAAANPPNPDAPELAAHFTGSSLTRYQATLRSLQEPGASGGGGHDWRALGVSTYEEDGN